MSVRAAADGRREHGAELCPDADTWSNRHAASLREVQSNFLRYGLLDDRVRFVEGAFVDTMGDGADTIAVLRFDGDAYESAMDVLQLAYPRLRWVFLGARASRTPRRSLRAQRGWHLHHRRLAPARVQARHPRVP